jgi:hypothetical protein
MKEPDFYPVARIAVAIRAFYSAAYNAEFGVWFTTGPQGVEVSNDYMMTKIQESQ